ncbi:MAG: hypothetical protein IPL29_03835 [Propionivibrio sp.]|nr:hypothetical protein [Propionivibrio sp.]
MLSPTGDPGDLALSYAITGQPGAAVQKPAAGIRRSATPDSVRHLDVENIIVLGHTQCGGIKCIVNQKMTSEPLEGFIFQLVRSGQPCATRCCQRMHGESMEAVARLQRQQGSHSGVHWTTC